MRFTLKKIFFVFLTLLIILIGYLLLQSVDLQRIRELLHDSEKFDLESLKQASLEIRKRFIIQIIYSVDTTTLHSFPTRKPLSKLH